MKHVAIIQRGFPHYRRALFFKLCQQQPPAPRYKVFYDNNNKSSIPFLRPVWLWGIAPPAAIDPLAEESQPKNISDNFGYLKNRWMGLLWQGRTISLALSSDFDTIIYEGNVHVLSTWVSAIVARMAGKRVLFWTHGFQHPEKGLKGRLITGFFKLAHGLLLYGQHGKQLCRQQGLDEKNLYVVYNSLDYERQIKIRDSISEQTCGKLKADLFPTPQLPLLLWVGRLRDDKRLDLALQAIRYLKDHGCPVNMLFVGAGPAGESLQALTEKLDLRQNVHFYGPCHEEKQVATIISAADICVSPGAIGLSCIHALTYGLPVITHDDPNRQGPEYQAILPGQTGNLFRYGDYKHLAWTIETWLSSKKPKARIQQACYRQIERYYNPDYQVKIFNAAVNAEAPDHSITNAHTTAGSHNQPAVCVESV